MSNKQPAKERRKSGRFPVKDGALAFMESNSNLIGQIDEIGKGGLSFKYLQLTNEKRDANIINLFVSKQNYLIEKLPVQVISDIQIVTKPSFSYVTMRRCGVQFGSLTKKQSTDLEFFIKQFSEPP